MSLISRPFVVQQNNQMHPSLTESEMYIDQDLGAPLIVFKRATSVKKAQKTYLYHWKTTHNGPILFQIILLVL